MRGKLRFYLYMFSMFAIMMSACTPTIPAPQATTTLSDVGQALTQTALVPPVIIPSPTATTSTEVTSTPAVPTSTATAPSSQGAMQFMAYIRDQQLFVRDVTNNQSGGASQYTIPGQTDHVSDLVWSPSGEFVAFVSTVNGDPHLFYIFALGESSPTDLGLGSAPAWSPDSKSIVYMRGPFPNDNIWITTVDNPSPRQLSSETNHAWGRPVFTSDGSQLVVATTDRNNLAATGNTKFTLEYLPLDGSGTRSPLPDTTSFDGRLPFDLHFSPDGTHLAFSTSLHESACAASGAYYVSNADGSNQQALVSPSLKAALDPNAEHFHSSLSYIWNGDSASIIVHGIVYDCAANSPTNGQVIAGPQLSIIGLDGSEPLIIPGYFYGISLDRTGTLIAAAHYKDFQDQNPMVEIYSAQTGQLVLAVGPGSNPQFQP